MTFSRRNFLITGSAGLVLTTCMGGGTTTLTVAAQAQTGMNPGPDGSDRPVTISILQMSSSGNFDSADAFALQNPAAALGPELLRTDQITLAPGGSGEKVIAIQPGASVIGVTGGFRDPAGKTVRTKINAPSGNQGVLINVGPGGISLTSV
ncbi:type VI secretion system lipoprotein TssJ [uncultured Shimia sp.]|uniref:type VI secretion system lipoprotein TssJ n=1 Tax=uncultured Shimia sp. TaxID=573152 RepID=UPI00263672F3|nr:type VI secretion system lipoprotein TssJ [uncultured Shimia sp.]